MNMDIFLINFIIIQSSISIVIAMLVIIIAMIVSFIKISNTADIKEEIS